MRHLSGFGLRPVLGSGEEIGEWAAFCRRTDPRALPAAIHVDTGMNRLGLPARRRSRSGRNRASAASGLPLLMSHLVCAEEPGNPVNERQIDAFVARPRRPCPDVPASLANSSGIFLRQRAALRTGSRPAIALYGGNPTPGRPNPMRPVVRLTGRIVQMREIGAGETVG